MCKTESCNNAPRKGRNYCGPCRNQREKDSDLAAWAYRKLKSNAKRRKHFFDLTLEQFRQFCVETKILLGRGRTATSLHVDRIEEGKGYTVGNLQPLTNRENILKDLARRAKRKIYDYELATKRRLGYIESEEESRVSEFRYVDDSQSQVDIDYSPF